MLVVSSRFSVIVVSFSVNTLIGIWNADIHSDILNANILVSLNVYMRIVMSNANILIAIFIVSALFAIFNVIIVCDKLLLCMFGLLYVVYLTSMILLSVIYFSVSALSLICNVSVLNVTFQYFPLHYLKCFLPP